MVLLEYCEFVEVHFDARIHLGFLGRLRRMSLNDKFCEVVASYEECNEWAMNETVCLTNNNY